MVIIVYSRSIYCIIYINTEVYLPLSGLDDHEERIELIVAFEALMPPFLAFPFRQNGHLRLIRTVHQSEIEYH